MKSIRQILRQPLRTAAGILLSALAVAVLCVALSQTLAAENTARELNETFLTVALPTADAPEDAEEIMDGLVEENPELFRGDVRNGLASAYIPELNIDNYTQHLQQSDGSTSNAETLPTNRNYSNAMLEIKILERTEPAAKVGTYGPLYIPYDEGYWSMEIEAQILRVIGLEQGYDTPAEEDMVKRKIFIEVKLPDEAAFEDFLSRLDLNTEDRYLVYGSEYWDSDWALRCNMAAIMVWREEPELLDWDLDRIEGFTDFQARMREESAARAEGREPDPKAYTRLKVKIGDLLHGLSWAEMDMFMHSRLTVGNTAALPRVLELDAWMEGDTVHVVNNFDESGYVSYTDAQGQEQSISDADYAACYDVPMMAKLEGTAEEFLAENPDWQAMLEDIDINSHAFPIVGVEGMRYVGQFSTGKAEISEGRDFTEEELAAGAKVCIISGSLAEAHGLNIGDTINPQFYQFDPIYPGQSSLAAGEGVLNVSAHFYDSATTPLLDAESYTIVGLYEQDSPWGKIDDDYYAFTPNTIFVPKASVPVDMEYSSHGMFRTLIVNSDKLLELQLLSVEEDLDTLFYYYDNGYNTVARQLDSFREAAQRFLPVGLAMYAVLILLFLFLFPGRTGRELAMMDSLGSGFGARVGHVRCCCLGLLIPGTAIGTALGLLLWRRVADFLAQWNESAISVELNVLSLWAASALQILIIAVISLAFAIPMAKRANLMKRK